MKRKGSIWIFLGLLLIAAALLLTGWNLQESRSAGDTSLEVMNRLAERMPTAGQHQTDAENSGETVPGQTMPDFEDSLPQHTLPDYARNPDIDMPTETIEGNEYIGVLEIPALELELPVMSQWSYPKLKVAPCRYKGSAYRNDLILMAHNYATHFGGLKNLRIGDSVAFTDMDGNVFNYEVMEVEVLQPAAIEEMESGDWDLTLFTCTVGGQSRITIRCELADERFG